MTLGWECCINRVNSIRRIFPSCYSYNLGSVRESQNLLIRIQLVVAYVRKTFQNRSSSSQPLLNDRSRSFACGRYSLFGRLELFRVCFYRCLSANLTDFFESQKESTIGPGDDDNTVLLVAVGNISLSQIVRCLACRVLRGMATTQHSSVQP